MALLSGARTKNLSQLAQQIVSRMKKLFPQLNHELMSASILLANIYGSLGQNEKAFDIRNELNRSGVKKKVGIAWTFVNEELFVSICSFF